ncbi:hypothetical protein K458DRAFT_489549 [Lentithecium fluviatile CBS 122367]|uniref:Uncharacterized protein n=1 Tax=Lentithecium fluviatile CBS 122367 TaxID=1168545 RepID=A0A6G1ISG2_9PLEO|nr:hypothetical protein K458DRAFT_489549 [Lentithecium fluviatile CBS 122367]
MRDHAKRLLIVQGDVRAATARSRRPRIRKHTIRLLQSQLSNRTQPRHRLQPIPDVPISHRHSEYPDTNDFDFSGGHITISGCLEPTINLAAYESYNSQQHSHSQALTSLHSLADLAQHDPHVHDHQNDSFTNLTLGVLMAKCYATRPSWHHLSLIEHLESAAEAYSDLIALQSSGGDVQNVMEDGGVVVGHGVLHG